MIQSIYNNNNVTITQTIDVNLYDSKYFRQAYELFGKIPLVNIISQQTGKNKTFRPTLIDLTNKDRYVSLTYTTFSTEILNLGFISFGNTDFPYGLYDLQIYASTSDDMSILGLRHIYTGLFNVIPVSTQEAVVYNEYSTNDTDTNSVYITN